MERDLIKNRLHKALHKIIIELQKEDPNAVGWIVSGKIVIETTAPEKKVEKLIEKYVIEDISLEAPNERRDATDK